MMNVVVLDADLAGATKTGMFKKAFPERSYRLWYRRRQHDRYCSRYLLQQEKFRLQVHLQCSQQDVHLNRFVTLSDIRHLNVKIGATHAGISVGEDGATHQCNEDIALMRTIPGMVVISPCR